MKKQILIVFQTKREDIIIPKSGYGAERSYEILGRILNENDTDLFLSNNTTNYLGNYAYQTNWKYVNGMFTKSTEIIEPYMVLDKTLSLLFPRVSDTNVLNPYMFKVLTKNKWLSYLEYPEIFPKTFLIRNDRDLQKSLNKITTDRVVIKDTVGAKGNLVEFFKRDDLPKILEFLGENRSKTFIMQEFIDTSKGDGKMLNKMHDLRMIFIGKVLVSCYVRIPADGTLKSNYSLGGSYFEMKEEEIPEVFISLANKIVSEFSTKYNDPIFTIDMGMDQNGEAKCFEFNSSPSFPGEDEPVWRDYFVKKLAERLLR